MRESIKWGYEVARDHLYVYHITLLNSFQLNEITKEIILNKFKIQIDISEIL